MSPVLPKLYGLPKASRPLRILASLLVLSTGLGLSGCDSSSSPSTPSPAASPSPTPFYGGGGLGASPTPLGYSPTPLSGSTNMPTDVVVRVNGVQGTSNIQVGTPVSWNIAASSALSPSDQFVIYDLQPSMQPSGMTINNHMSQSVTVAYTPLQSDPMSGTMTVHVRDMTVCNNQQVSSGGGGGQTMCTQFTNIPNSAYDVTQTFSWNLSGSTGGFAGLNSGQGDGNNSIGSSLITTLISTLLPQLLGGGGGLASLSNLLTGGSAPNTQQQIQPNTQPQYQPNTQPQIQPSNPTSNTTNGG